MAAEETLHMPFHHFYKSAGIIRDVDQCLHGSSCHASCTAHKVVAWSQRIEGAPHVSGMCHEGGTAL